MKPIIEVLSKYKTIAAASRSTGVAPKLLSENMARGALVEPDGTIWIRSKTKLNLNGIEEMTKNYVKEFKGYRVPDGATHFTEESKTDHAAFWSKYFMWVLINGYIEEYPADDIPKDAIELPEASI